MQENELYDLVLAIHRQKTEKQTVELKAAAKGFPKIFDTLSSFANQDIGGIIIFGIGDKPHNRNRMSSRIATLMSILATFSCKNSNLIRFVKKNVNLRLGRCLFTSR